MMRCMWLVHNVIGHPLMGLLFFVGLRKAGDWVHDITLPPGVSVDEL